MIMAMCKLVTYLIGLFIVTSLAACVPLSQNDEISGNTSPPGVQARVVFVIDGDTIDVESQGGEYRARNIGVDTCVHHLDGGGDGVVCVSLP